VELWWNLVDSEDAVSKAVDVAKTSDLIVLAVGANWNSDGENGDRATLGLSENQTVLADALFNLGIPIVLVLQGGRPFAIPEYYTRCAATLETMSIHLIHCTCRTYVHMARSSSLANLVATL